VLFRTIIAVLLFVLAGTAAAAPVVKTAHNAG
jgi:hypothetical protein